MKRVEKYVDQVLEQLQSPNEEREDIREELISHIFEAKTDYKEQGFSDKESEQKALEDFGDANNIGKTLQEAIYPFQRGFLYMIGFLMIGYGIIFYLDYAFNMHERIPVWLAIQLLLGGVVTLAAINISFVGRHFYLLHVCMIVGLIWTGIDLLMVETLPSHGHNVFLSFYLIILMILNLIFIFRNSYYSAGLAENEKKNKKALMMVGYLVNLLIGICLIFIALFFTWAMLAFSEFNWIIIFPLVLIISWLIFYKFQMKFIAKKPILSIVAGVGFSVFIIGFPLLIVNVISNLR